jgi:uncharacterized SAM-binding protein YcdF (DUF218 family)
MTSQWWRRKTTWLSLAAVALLAIAVPLTSRALGRWLIVSDPLQPARAIVVLSGHLPFRALEGAELYRAGWAKEVWITQGERSAEETALERLNIDRDREAELSREVLVKQGVPRAVIHILPERNRNTADEVGNISRHLRDAGGGRVIIVTSKFHTRRVKLLWRHLAAANGEALVRYTPDDTFDPAHWWRTTRDTMAVAREYGSLLNAWAGFPISAGR